jgi:prepilin-type N-terminal cleavage/methylation domain-containing protein/prepilin-type processing-associated H-X9-DG protein
MSCSKLLKCGSPKRAFTLVELLVVISIIALLLAILMPSLQKAREQGKRVVCASNQKQLGLAYVCYMAENSDKFPGVFSLGRWWSFSAPGYYLSEPPYLVDNHDPQNDTLGKYVKSPKTWWCPAFPKNYQPDRRYPAMDDPEKGNDTSYFYMVLQTKMPGTIQKYTAQYKLTDVKADTAILMFDMPYTVNRSLGQRPIHKDGLTVLFLDGHVEHRHLYYDMTQEIAYGVQGYSGWWKAIK